MGAKASTASNGGGQTGAVGGGGSGGSGAGGGATTAGGQARSTDHHAATTTRARNFSSSSSSSEVAISNSVAFNPFRAIPGMHVGGVGGGMGGGGTTGGGRSTGGEVVGVVGSGTAAGGQLHWAVGTNRVERARSLSMVAPGTSGSDHPHPHYALHASNHPTSHQPNHNHPVHHIDHRLSISPASGLLLPDGLAGVEMLMLQHQQHPLDHLAGASVADEATESMMASTPATYHPLQQPNHQQQQRLLLQQQQQHLQLMQQQQNVALTLSGRVYTTTSLPSHIWSLNGKPEEGEKVAADSMPTNKDLPFDSSSEPIVLCSWPALWLLSFDVLLLY